MRTLSEEEEHRDNKRKNLVAERRREVQAIIDKGVPLHAKATEEGRQRLREAAFEERANLVSFACDHCRTPLYAMSGFVLASSPPQRRVGCPGCGWSGTTSL